jgi:hypothetical protein
MVLARLLVVPFVCSNETKGEVRLAWFSDQIPSEISKIKNLSSYCGTVICNPPSLLLSSLLFSTPSLNIATV